MSFNFPNMPTKKAVGAQERDTVIQAILDLQMKAAIAARGCYCAYSRACDSLSKAEISCESSKLKGAREREFESTYAQKEVEFLIETEFLIKKHRITEKEIKDYEERCLAKECQTRKS